MRFWIFALLFLCGRPGWSFEPPSGWEPVFIPKIQEAWKQADKPIYVLISESLSEKDMSFSGLSDAQVIAGITGVRRSILSNFGIQAWQIYNLKKIEIAKDEWKLEYSGFFTSTTGKNVEFQEVSYVRGREMKLATVFDYSGEGIEKLSIVLNGYQPQFTKTRTVSSTLEGKFCIDCSFDELAQENKVHTISIQNTCDKQKGWIDPKRQSIFEKSGIKTDASGFWEQISYNTLSCLWGLGDGIYSAVKDLILLLPSLLDLAESGTHYAKQKLWDSWNVEDVKKSFTWSNIKESAGKLADKVSIGAKVSYEKAKEVLRVSNEKMKSAFEKNAAEASFSLIAMEMYQFTPAKIAEKALGKIWKMIEPTLMNEWQGYQCLSSEAKSEIACKVISYVATNFASGGVIVKGFSKAPKLISFIKDLKEGYVRTAAVKKVAAGVEVAEAALPQLDPNKWSLIRTGKLEQLAAEMQQAENGKYYMRTWRGDQFAYREMNEKSLKSIVQAYDGVRDLKASSNPVEFLNSRYVRSPEDYARQMNEVFDLKLSSKKINSLAAKMEKDTVFAKDYSDFLVKLQPYFQSSSKTKSLDTANDYLKNLHEFVLSSKDPIDLKRAAKIFTEAADKNDVARLEFWSNTWKQLATADAKNPLRQALPCFLKAQAVSALCRF